MPLEVVESLTESQLADLCRLYQSEWWTGDRTTEGVRAMLENTSLMIGLVDQEGRLVAFCRVLTDFVYRGMLYDVMVDPELRGQGLGRRLMDVLAEHPRLRGIECLWLACKEDKEPFYEKWDYVRHDHTLVWMRRTASE